MIEPPKLAVFLVVVTAHLAVLAFGFPSLAPPPEDRADRQSGTSSAELVEAERTTSRSAAAIDSDDPGLKHENAYGHGAAPRSPSAPSSNNPAATRAGHQSQQDSSGQVDTVPTLEEHRRQHGPKGHPDDPDNDADAHLVDRERIARNDEDHDADHTAGNDDADALGEKREATDQPRPSGIVSAPKASPDVKPLPIPGTAGKPDVSATRPTPVQMISPEKPVAAPSAPKLKPVAIPAKATRADSAPRARPVPNSPQPASPASNRAGAGRMKNLRPIK